MGLQKLFNFLKGLSQEVSSEKQEWIPSLHFIATSQQTDVTE